MNKMALTQFINKYSLSKTLRTELRPIGKTLEHIKKDGFLTNDGHRATSYQLVKKLIDKYHKRFIEDVLDEFELKYTNEGKLNSLEEFYALYMENYKDDKQIKSFEKIQEALRKQIANSFKDDKRFDRIFKKELIKKDIFSIVSNEAEYDTVKEFDNFTTYFTGFHKNRSNMYSHEEKSTAIAFRLIHENLPKFIDNMNAFQSIANSPVSNNLTELYKNFSEYLNVKEIAEMFNLDYFNFVLSQKQIDVYNAIIGGKSLNDGTKIKGINEYVNLYNQQQKDKSARLPKLKPLFKQILSDRNAISWLPEQFQSDNDLLEAIAASYKNLEENVINCNGDGQHSLKELLQNLSDYDLNKIFIRNDLQLTDISQKIFGNWGVINKALTSSLKNQIPRKLKKESDESFEERIEKILSQLGSISIAQINDSVKEFNPEIEDTNTIQNYFAKFGENAHNNCNIFDQIATAYNAASELLNTDYNGKNLADDKQNVEKIKTLLDAIKDLQRFIKPLLGDGKESDKDNRFYGEFTLLWEELDKITPLYNKVRNYLTRKPYSLEKVKLNFENSTLLDGWDVNKEKDNTSVILRKDGQYYLAIMNKKHKNVFSVKNLPTEGECYEKMQYKQIADAGKDIQNIINCNGEFRRFTKDLDKLKKEHIPVISAIKQKGSYLQDDPKSENKKFSRKDLNTYIDYYKEAATKYWSWCDFKFHDTASYSNWKDFTNHVNMQGYKISFRNVSVDYINQLVDEGKIYLFQIYNKDFSPNSKGTPNLHTLYWKMLFDEDNLSDVVYKLNGQAEVFYRESSILAERPTHPANEPIDNKNTLNKKKQSVFSYDLIKNKRFSIDKFMFHVPITMNFKSEGINNINAKVNEYIKQTDDLHIIGIDRGERHLLYLSVIDMKGNIKEQYSLNEIVNTYNGNEYRTNYHDLLKKREQERKIERESWKTIDSIKELKEGYLSQVIHKISELMVKYNAIVVLEDLNAGFMRGRQKVEHSVYQKFEKMLIDKLNYLVDKKKSPTEPGGLLNAFQLTNKFESFQKLGKQSGFLFYTQAWNTSKIDPVTGFVNLLDTRYVTREKAKTFFSKFDSITYNAEKGWFEFAFDYTRFTTKANGSKTKWTLCTVGNRVESFRNPAKNNNWDSREIDLTEKFIEFFKQYGIDHTGNLKEAIAKQDTKDFFSGLLYLLRLTLQLRNSETGTDVDYMQSPIADENGNFYNSNICGKTLPENADANGAYNIARKGLMIIHKIKADETGKPNLAISNKEWLKFAQNKPYLNE